MRPANGVVLALALSAGCAVLPGQIHVLADADGPEARQDAVAEAIRWLGDRRRPVALRSSAARALGRLRSAEPASVSALAAVLEQRYEPRELRCFAAWALGELRSPDSLAALTSALRTGLSEPVAAYVFEALAKHAAVMAGDEKRLLDSVEALVFYAGNHQGVLPPMYQLLDDRNRTVAVNVRVLERTLNEARKQPSSRSRAAMYAAAFELLARLDDRRAEIAAGPALWAARIDATIDVAGEVYAFDDLRTQLLVLYFLGRVASGAEIADRSAEAVGRWQAPRAPQGSIQLVATWALHRLQLSALGPRRALVTDVLTRAYDPAIMRLIADLSRGDPTTKQTDAPQRWLDLGHAP